MKDFLEYILKNIVKNPDQIEISESEDEKGPCLIVKLAEEDKPLVIGRLGRNIRAIRQIVSILGRKENKNYYIKIED